MIQSDILGVIAVLLAIIGYGAYLRNVLRGRTKPHAMTWLVWGSLNSFVFFEQLIADAGPGAWVTGATAIANVIIFFYALHYGERTVTRFDWLCLALVASLLLLWQQVSDPTVTIAIAVTIYVAGFLPTLLKASKNPYEETVLTFAMNGIKFFLAILALSSITVVTATYPITLCVVNTGFALYLLYLRRVHPQKKRRRRRA